MITNAITAAEEQGPREYQEDKSYIGHIKYPNFEGWLLAVMDGHGGAEVSEVCKRELTNPKIFAPQYPKDVEQSLLDLVAALNALTCDFNAGSTLSVACVFKDEGGHRKVSIAILGDSPVVVVDYKGQLYVSPEHNVRSNLAEREAAESRGGFCRDGYLYASDSGPGLQLSRALGDALLSAVLSREPDVITISDPKWVLVASDGLIDPGHGESETLFQEIKSHAEAHANAPDLMEWVKSRGLKDNAIAVVWQ